MVVVFVAQSCLTLATPWTVASSVHGIFQIRILEWVAISFSRGSSRPRNRTEASCIAVRERASERWKGSAGEDGNVPRFGGRAEAPGERAPGPEQWTTDGQPGRPVQDRLPRSHAQPRRAACETPQKLRAVRSRTLGSSGQRQKRRRVGGRGWNLGLPKPSDPLSSDVAGRSGGRETPERTPRGAGQGGAGWATLVMERVVGGDIMKHESILNFYLTLVSK